MDKDNIYEKISKRTQGDIYLGVVGPVRTGKSTFIKRFMDLLVIPQIDNIFLRERTRDELPQSAAGKTIMTTEPKFVPNEAVEINISDNARLKVRLVDCVGYLVKGAMGYLEDNMPRMVTTPWFDYEIPFTEAAEIGTRKVIHEHSTIGILVTCDGSITDIDRKDYIESEERVVEELKRIDKPFVVVLNSVHPELDETVKLQKELEQKYQSRVIRLDVAKMGVDEIHFLMEQVLFEFPLVELMLGVPSWVVEQPSDFWLKREFCEAIRSSISEVRKVRELYQIQRFLGEFEPIKKVLVEDIDLGTGCAKLEISFQEGVFFRVLSESTGIHVDSEQSLIKIMKDLSVTKKEFDKFESAIREVREKGYGIVAPQLSELTLEEPQIVRHGNRFGVKLRASAPSIHMMLANIETEISPLVGTEKQSEELVNYLIKEFMEQPDKIWQSNIFGKSVYELVTEGLQNKLYRMPEDAQMKLTDALQRIINDGSSSIICIIL